MMRCIHGRAGGKMCPHCMGLSATLNGRDSGVRTASGNRTCSGMKTRQAPPWARLMAGFPTVFLAILLALLALLPSCTTKARAEIVNDAMAALARAACKPTVERCIKAKQNPCAELKACQEKRRQAFGLMREVVK